MALTLIYERPSNSVKRTMIIDAHTHFWDPKELPLDFSLMMQRGRAHHSPGGPWPERRPELLGTKEGVMVVTEEEFMQDMEDADIDKVVLLALDMTKTWKCKISNERIAEFVGKYPDRIIGIASVAPIDENNRFNKKCLKEFENAVTKYGFRGLKLAPSYNQYSPDRKEIYPLYQKAVDVGAPFLYFHCGIGIQRSTFRDSDPILLQDILDDFPELKVIVAHLGFPWREVTLAMMRKYPNLLTDISALCRRTTILTWSLVMAKEYSVLDRVLFGTDYPGVCRPPKEFVHLCKEGINKIAEKAGWPTFSTEEINGILGENARRIGLC